MSNWLWPVRPAVCPTGHNNSIGTALTRAARGFQACASFPQRTAELLCQPLLLAIYANTNTKGLQNKVVRKLLQAPEMNGLMPFFVAIELPGSYESSRRTRGLLHVGLACIAAGFLQSHEVIVYENGIGAINLPLDHTQFGTMTTRGVHPEWLHDLALLAAQVLESRIQIRLPNLWRTKGDMCQQLWASGLWGVADETASCVQKRSDNTWTPGSLGNGCKRLAIVSQRLRNSPSAVHLKTGTPVGPSSANPRWPGPSRRFRQQGGSGPAAPPARPFPSKSS